MSAQIIDGKAVAAEIRGQIRAQVEALKASGLTPGLATLLVGEDPASQIYVKNKHKACQEAGMTSFNYTLPKDSSHQAVLDKVRELNADPRVHGILVQLPLPPQVNSDEILNAIDPRKDADGFHPYNLGRMLAAKDYEALINDPDPVPLPCTPRGCVALIERTGVSMKGKNAVVVGRSNIVGKPMALLLLGLHATVTVTHSRTKDLAGVCREADILIAAIGKPKMITGDMIKPGAIVIDVGINRLADGKVCGDVDFEPARERAGWITPVPGGVGPMTIVMLLMNTLRLAKARAASI
jgi:methylenetetrahydrofolate dehydrogenase (NADP+)/methenyltetrahydrofolate cyclohydrolase